MTDGTNATPRSHKPEARDTTPKTSRTAPQPDLAGAVPGQQLVDPDVQARFNRHPIQPQRRGEETF